MEAYLDNSATTLCCQASKEIMVKTLTEDFGNPSSMHMKGVEAEKYVKNAASIIAKTLRCQEKEFIRLTADLGMQTLIMALGQRFKFPERTMDIYHMFTEKLDIIQQGACVSRRD